MQLDRQLRVLPACQASAEELRDQFDPLIKDFHFAFVNMTWAVSQGHYKKTQCKHVAVFSIPAIHWPQSLS